MKRLLSFASMTIYNSQLLLNKFRIAKLVGRLPLATKICCAINPINTVYKTAPSFSSEKEVIFLLKI